jgi:PAS domain S-box-containing protein
MSNLNSLSGQRRLLHSALTLMGALALLLLALWWFPQLRFRLPTGATVALHTALETASIAAALMVFSVSWYALGATRSSVFGAAAPAFASVALLDFAHMLMYQGMPVFVDDYTLSPAIAFFLAARLLAGVALLAIALAPPGMDFGPSARRKTLYGALLFAGLVLAVGFAKPQWLPVYLIPGEGLTATKVASDGVIVAVNVAAALAFYRRLKGREDYPNVFLMAASTVMALSELLFTLYATTTDQFIHVAHVYKIIAYLLVFWSLVVVKIRQPFEQVRSVQAHLAEQQARLASIIASAMDGIISVDEQQRVLLFNEAAERMFQRDAGAVLGQPLDALLPARFQAAHGAQMSSFGTETTSNRTMGLTRATFGVRSNGEEFPVEASISKALVDGKTVFTVILRDITGRLKAEQDMRTLHEELEQRVIRRTAELQAANAERDVRLAELEALAVKLREANAELANANAELDTYAFTVSHDLRAPLRSIDGYSALLLAELPADIGEQPRHLLDRIRARVKHMGSLLEDLLHMSRFSRQEIERVDLDVQSLVGAIVEDMAQSAPAVRFEVGELPRCHADAGQLHQLWTNLISNAVKYSAKAPSPEVRIGFENGTYFITDNGAGFDMAYADKLFRVFSRLHAEHEFTGTGIGLAIVKRVVQRHGGEVRAEGAICAGARFFFSIPG